MHEYESRSGNQGTFLIGLLAGAAVGAALGVVLAPCSGAETRRKLAASGERLKDEANRTYAQASEGVQQFVSRGREAIDRGREAFQRARTSADSAIAEVRTEEPLSTIGTYSTPS
jgi:gas vesicle protein